MMHSDPTDIPPGLMPQVPGTYKCGTLTYTKMGLTALFAWLLWGDFCFNIMETVVPTVLPLKLKALGASNNMMSIIMTSLPAVLNMTVCPWVSFKSDRHRGRWGRRIPFILSTMPFLCFFMILLGYGEEIAAKAQHAIPALTHLAPTSVTIGVISVLLILLKFFDMFVNSVFWYLFNDVVPAQFLGRFMGLFRMMGTVAGSFYNFFLMEHSESHMREILIGVSLLYFFGFGAMCIFVKEGKYPPPPENVDKKVGFVSSLKSFGKQSFTSKFYWYFYLANAFGTLAGSCGMFGVFFNKQMGLTLKQMGALGGWAGIAAFCATYITSVFVDRWHPLRITTYMAIFATVAGFGGWIWVYVTLPGTLYYWLSLGGMLVGVFSACLREACDLPLFMRLMPRSLYGQFSSANATVRSVARIVGGFTAGLFLDFVQWLNHGSDIAYRWIFVWVWLFGIVSTIFLCLGYREWKRLGGDNNYRPPTPWRPEGFEEVVDKVAVIPSPPRKVMLAMWLGVVGAVISLLMVVIFMIFMLRHGLNQSFHWYLWAFIPIKVWLTLASIAQAIAVRRDISAHERGESTRMGIPHHGVLLVNAIQGLLWFPIFWYQTVEMIHLDFEPELMLFGVASLASMAAGLFGIQIVRWLESEKKIQPGL